jgi:hypothetical protein
MKNLPQRNVIQVPFRQKCVHSACRQGSWQEVTVENVGLWQELVLIGASVLVMGMVCALEGWSR